MGAREKIKAGEPTVVHGMASSKYHADPCATPSLSASLARTLTAQSALHAWSQHPRLGGKKRKPDPAMDMGSVVHAVLLGTEHELVVIQADDYRTDAAKDLRDAARANGQIPVLPHDLEKAREAVKQVRKRLKRHGIVLTGKSEVSLFWQEQADDGTPVQCRARVDHLIVEPMRVQIIDLKTARSAHPEACASHAYGYGYDIQAAAYRSAIRTVYPSLAGREEFHFLFAEIEEPYAVTPAELDGSFRELGERRWRRAVNTWATCMRTNEWPDYGRCLLSAPKYALMKEEEELANGEYRSG